MNTNKLLKLNNNTKNYSNVSQLIQNVKKNSDINQTDERQNKRRPSVEKSKSQDGEIELSYNSTIGQGREKYENNMSFYSKDEIKDKITTIFKNFAKYSNDDKSFDLTLAAILKLIKNLNLLNETNLKLSDIDIIFKSVSKSNKLTESQFINFVLRLAEKIYPKEYKQDKKECINYLIFNVFEPYSKTIENKEVDIDLPIKEFTHKICLKFINYPIDSRLSGILNSIFYTLREIYLRYFELEQSLNKDLNIIEEDSLKSFTGFCKDFEIIPYILTNDQLTAYYKSLIKYNPNDKDFSFNLDVKREIGKCLTLSRFCISFVHFALINHGKTNLRKIKQNVSDVDKLILFLEKLENTDGLKNIEKKRSRPHSIKISFIPSEDILKMLDCNVINSNDNIEENNNSNRTSNKLNITCFNKINVAEKSGLINFLNVRGEIYELINSKIEELKEIFNFYSEMGDKLNCDRMSVTSFSKFLRDCGVIGDVNKERREIWNTQLNKSKSFSKSPLRKRNLDDLSSTDFKSVNNRIVNFKPVSGKLCESDINVIYYNLTGPKNFDNSTQIKNHFNKNYGFTGSFEGNLTKAIIFDKKDLIKSNNTMMAYKLDFFLFIKSFELISSKIYPDLTIDMAVENFFKNYLSKVLDNSQTLLINKDLTLALEKLNEPHIQDFTNECKYFILDLYKFYATTNNLLRFEQFFDFYKDFNLFPDLINLVQLKTVYNHLSENYAKEEKSKIKIAHSVDKSFISSSEVDTMKALNYVKNDFIDFNSLVNSLAITAVLYNSKNDWSDMDRILYLVMKIQQSIGMKNVKSTIGKTS